MNTTRDNAADYADFEHEADAVFEEVTARLTNEEIVAMLQSADPAAELIDVLYHAGMVEDQIPVAQVLADLKDWTDDDEAVITGSVVAIDGTVVAVIRRVQI